MLDNSSCFFFLFQMNWLLGFKLTGIKFKATCKLVMEEYVC